MSFQIDIDEQQYIRLFNSFVLQKKINQLGKLKIQLFKHEIMKYFKKCLEIVQN